jgi:hypothetical protein
METLELLKRALNAAASVLKFGSGIQRDARQGLIKDLHRVCMNCENAYDIVLMRLSPIKDAFGKPDALASELRLLRADNETRGAFKPEHLCGEVDYLLDRLENNLDSLRYSVDVSKIRAIRQTLQNMGNFDAAIYASYDQFTSDLDRIATQLQDASEDQAERAQYARRVIEDFEAELRSAVDGVREAKDMIIRG